MTVEVTAFEVATRLLLNDNALEQSHLGIALGRLAGRTTDFADLFLRANTQESWALSDGKVSSGSFHVEQGIGLRAVTGDRTAFAHTSDMSPGSLRASADAVRSMCSHGDDTASRGGIDLRQEPVKQRLYTPVDPFEDLDSARKIALLQQIDRRARASDPRIVRVEASLSVSNAATMIACSDGPLSADLRPSIVLHMTVFAQSGPKQTTGSSQVGGPFRLEEIDEGKIKALIRKATHIALVNLEARRPPAGTMSVVLGHGFPGLLLHEAVGHGLEGDFHRKKSSVFTKRMFEKIAASGVTVVDEGSMPGRLGSLNIDDEGTPTQRTVLIEDGRLVGLMQDRLNGRLMNQRSTGNARRQSYAHLPMPRMTNTYLASGNRDPAEILESVQNGIYAVSFGGGQVDITSGQFNFTTTEAYRIENGRVTYPISGATLIGLGHEALNHISMVGNDFQIADGLCGKEGQDVLVGVGQPTIRIDNMVVGGTH